MRKRSLKILASVLSIPIIPIVLTPLFLYLAEYQIPYYCDNDKMIFSYLFSLGKYLLTNIYFISLIGIIAIAVIYKVFTKIKRSDAKKRTILKLTIFIMFFGMAYATMTAVSAIISYENLGSKSIDTVNNIIEEINSIPKEEFAKFDEESLNSLLDNNETINFRFNYADLDNEIVFDKLKDEGNLSTFYVGFIEKYYEGYSVPDVEFTNEDTFIYNDYLYINDFSEDKPTFYQKLGYYFVKEYIQEESIEFPNINVMNRDEYVVKREQGIDELIAEYDEYIAILEESVDLAKQWVTEDEIYAEIYGGMWWTWLEEDREWLAYYEETLAEWVEWRNRIEEQKISALTELGLFSPPNEIDIVLADYEYYPAEQYVGTLVHEYFHYISNNEEYYLHDFIEEGITEYYTEKVLTEKLGYNNHYSYSNIVPMIEEIINDVGEEKVLEIYFSKNHEAAVQMLNDAYGENFWQDHEMQLYYITYMYDEVAIEMVDEINAIIY